ncbi:hypothetical protein H7J06_30105 [Mycobacterium hodleri]|uniref:hypothetical protein n=1 Tax=Mycolicibacterium hodleri TaxID=49897 RepID=UPI0021F2FB89|nr:hypothetical protein [Mycolicibacterium hodleri]MCV7137223.1 hypothetical protein [Mycolicibacterium hodleri]
MSGRHRTDQSGQSDSESDVEDDAHVAASRADGDGGGNYVGEQSSDDDFDAGETGAEARAQD